ncbi:MAG: YdcF family protein [Bacteroidetes bacterium]|nr:YdcF family protein [Bacteroidota bacterium]
MSKILAFLITPLTWFFSLCAWAFFTSDKIRKKKIIIAATCLLYLFSNPFFVDEIMRLWEPITPDLKPTQKYKQAILLGGMTWYDARLDRPQFLRSADRLFQTLPLLGTKQIEQIIITGGAGSLAHPEEKEAAILKAYLLRCGYADSSILIENESRNTYENAVFTKHLLDSLHTNDTVLFVTSAFHLRRAAACFKKAGVKKMRWYPTDRYSGPRKFELDHLFIPNPEALAESTLLLHEIMGYCIYKLKGFC